MAPATAALCRWGNGTLGHVETDAGRGDVVTAPSGSLLPGPTTRITSDSGLQGALRWTDRKVQLRPKRRSSQKNCRLSLVFEELKTWWTFRIFFIFSARGRGRGSPGRQGWGRSIFYWKSQGGGGGCLPGGEQGEKAGRVSVGNLGGGGGNIFFGAEIPTQKRTKQRCLWR